MANPKEDDFMIMSFALYLNKWRRKFEWDMEQFEELMTYLVDVFPPFHQFRACFNVAWNAARFNDIKPSNTQSDNPSAVEENDKAKAEMVFKCYACGQDIKTDDGTSTSSTRRNKKKKNRKKKMHSSR